MFPVIRVSEGSILESVIGTSIDTYDFCMCNPPFFADHFEAQGLLSRTVNRPEPRTISTASPQECVAEGGEVGFVRKMIEESVYFQQKIRFAKICFKFTYSSNFLKIYNAIFNDYLTCYIALMVVPFSDIQCKKKYVD